MANTSKGRVKPMHWRFSTKVNGVPTEPAPGDKLIRMLARAEAERDDLRRENARLEEQAVRLRAKLMLKEAARHVVAEEA